MNQDKGEQVISALSKPRVHQSATGMNNTSILSLFTMLITMKSNNRISNEGKAMQVGKWLVETIVIKGIKSPYRL